MKTALILAAETRREYAKTVLADLRKEECAPDRSAPWVSLYFFAYGWAASKLKVKQLDQFARAYADVESRRMIPVDPFFHAWQAGVFEANEAGIWAVRSDLED